MKFSGRKDGQFRSGGLLVGDRPFFVLQREYEVFFKLSKISDSFLTVGSA